MPSRLGHDSEAALGMAGIETFLVEVQALLSKSGLCEDDVDAVLRRDDTAERLDELEDALSGLRRSLLRAREALSSQPCPQPIARLAAVAHG